MTPIAQHLIATAANDNSGSVDLFVGPGTRLYRCISYHEPHKLLQVLRLDLGGEGAAVVAQITPQLMMPHPACPKSAQPSPPPQPNKPKLSLV